MKTHLVKMVLITLVVMLLSFSLVACGSGDNDGDVFVWSEESEITDTTNEHAVDREGLEQIDDDNDASPFYGQHLTVGITEFDRQRYHSFAMHFMNRNPGVTIELIRFGSADAALFDIEEIHTQINTNLMTGTAPTLLISPLVEYVNPHIFVDLFPIMEANPNFVEDNWFMSVFDADTTANRLLSFSGAFVYYNVVVNSAIPGLLEAIGTRDTISLWEMMDLHEQLNNQANPKYIFPGFDLLFALRVSYNNFLDLESRVVDFGNPNFVDLINRVRTLTNPAHNFVEYPENLFTSGCRESEIIASGMQHLKVA